VFALLALGGCATSGMGPSASLDMTAPSASMQGPPQPEIQMAALELPDTIAVVPTSYAGPTPSAAMNLAALAPAALRPMEAAPAPASAPAMAAELEDSRTVLDGLIAKYAALYQVPEALVRRVVKRESNFRPQAYNSGHWGLMQIKHATARGMGYAGPANGLLDAETNLRYAVKYLRGAFLVAQGDHDRADRLYQTGYYYHAKRMGLLGETGLGRDRIARRAGP
jgi:soluble lytic murein transglycosylase-like protein